MRSKIYNFLDNLTMSNYKRYKIMSFWFAPIFLLFEYIVYKYWWKIILTELITSKDDIINFLNKNEFALQKGRLIKKEIYDDIEFLTEKTTDEAKEIIKIDYVEKLTALIAKDVSLDLENYITIIVETDNKITNINGNNYSNFIYTVYIQFCRYWYLSRNIKLFIYWLLLFLPILLGILFILLK